MIRYGTSPIAWSNDDDHRMGADISLRQCLTDAADIGFDGIEMGHKFPTDPTELKAELAPHGLRLVAGWHSMNLLSHSVAEEKKAIQPHLDLLKAMGCSLCIVCETSNATYRDRDKPLQHSPSLEDEDWARFGGDVEDIATFCADQGLVPVYRHHVGTIVETPDEIDRFMAVTGAATKLLFDTGHCYLGGGNPAEVLGRHMARVAHIHAKNVRPIIMGMAQAEGLSFPEAVRRGVFTVPGDFEGGVEFEPVLSIAAVHGYDGWLVVGADQDPTQRNPKETQGIGLKALKIMARAAGLDG